MNKEELTKALEYTEKKHRHDIVNTFDTDISMMCIDVLRVLKNCIEIPDNATNGDIIKAMFPNIEPEVVEYIKYIGESKVHGKEVVLETSIRFELDWWNAPYRRETE